MEHHKSPLRILLTDDDEGDRFLFEEIMDEIEMDIRLHMVHDGKQLMEYLANSNNTLPHIIYLDLNMAYMNGIECLKEIRSQKKYSDISIVIYSTSKSEKDIEETFRHGANIYITKPGGYNNLKQVMAKSLTAVRLNRESDFDRENFVLRV